METFYSWILRVLKRLSVLSLLLLTPNIFAQQSFIGNWENGDKSSVVQLYEFESQFYAKIIADNDREKIGKIVLIQMEMKSDTRLFGGTFYDTKLKLEHEAKLKLINPDTIQIKISNGIIPKTVVWHRVQPPKTSIVSN